MSTKKKKTIIISITATVLAVLLFAGLFPFVKMKVVEFRAYRVAPLSDSMLENSGYESADKLMIVAHPDDELIFGGGHLLEGGYFVVCITNGRNKTRSEEFRRVIRETGNNGIILNYPDKVNGKRDDWSNVRDGILSDIEKVIDLKDWKEIVTHNENGEYGHQHHKMTHSLVVEGYEAEKPEARLYFFGKYHKAVTVKKYESGEKPMPEDMKNRLPDDVFARKTEISKLYKSQKHTIDGLWHIAPYENFTEYVATQK